MSTRDYEPSRAISEIVVPELPEVEHERRRLQRAMAGHRIERVELRRATLRGPFSPGFAARLEGCTVRRVRRRAKYLLVELSSGDQLVMHLGMSGSFRITRASGLPATRYHHPRSDDDKHDHVVFHLSSGGRVIFNDPRRFGSMAIVEGRAIDAHPALGALGPEPLARTFDARRLAQALRGKKTAIKVALLDQGIVAGLGNIYASEALHLAGVSPRRAAGALVTSGGKPRPALTALAAAIPAVLRKAIGLQARYKATGDRFLVYDREGEPCLRAGCHGIIRRIVQAGRSTFYCPVCQKR